MDILSALVLVTFIAYVAIRGTRNYLLKRSHQKEEDEAIAKKLPPEKVRKIQARNAFARGEDTRGMMLLRGDKPDT